MSEPRLIGDRYELGSLLGYGGMAEVHQGRDVRLGRQVAIKILRSDLARDPSFQTRFRREAQAAGGLNHPNIVAVYDTGEDNGPDGSVPYIVMEYVDGRTLRDVLSMEGRLEANRAMEIVAEVCAALDFSHRHGIVHRDIKPANVMITRSGTAKVMDFGIARAVADGSSNVTQTAAVIGTAQYLSPEQARGETVDARSDVYSTGCLLYELVTGHPPFQGDSPVAVAYQHVRESAPVPSSIVSSVPRALDSIVMKALAKNAMNRYQTAGEMRTDLLNAAAARPVVAEPVMTEDERTQMIARQAPAPADRPRRDSAIVPLAEDEEESGSRRGALLWTAAIVVLLLVIAGGAFLLFRPKNDNNKAADTPQRTQVPSLAGKTAAEATKLITESNLMVADGSGQPVNENTDCQDAAVNTVCTQSPDANEMVELNKPVTFTIYVGPKKVAVPYLIDQNLTDAQATIQRLGLVPSPVQKFTGDPAGTVVDQNPKANTSVAVGTKITIYYSTGRLKVPNVAGLTYGAARAKLQQLGFTNLNSRPGTDPNTDPKKAGTVSRTDPVEGSVRAPDALITLVLYATPKPTCTTPPTSPTNPPTSGQTTPPTSSSPPTGSGTPTTPPPSSGTESPTC